MREREEQAHATAEQAIRDKATIERLHNEYKENTEREGLALKAELNALRRATTTRQ